MALSVPAAVLYGCIVESFLYGFFLLLWAASIHILVFRYRLHDRPINKTLLTGSVLVFCCVTVHWVTDVVRISMAFVEIADSPEATLGYLLTYEDANQLAKTASVLVGCWIMEAFLVYRVWVIWNRAWLAPVVPSLFLGGFIAASIGLMVKFSHLTQGANTRAVSVRGWVVGAFTASMATTVSSTCLIVYRLLKADRNHKVLGSDRMFLPIIRIVVESAALFSAFTIFVCVCFLTTSRVGTIALDLTSAVTGITFSLLIVRVGFNFTNRSSRASRPPTSATALGTDARVRLVRTPRIGADADAAAAAPGGARDRDRVPVDGSASDASSQSQSHPADADELALKHGHGLGLGLGRVEIAQETEMYSKSEGAHSPV